MRRSTPADAEPLAEFNSMIHSDLGLDKPDERIGAWVRDLLTRSHPTFDAGDFTLVEDTRTGRIVSSLNLISQTWTYAGIPFRVGRPELVGTDPEFRNRGLVRIQFDGVTARDWSFPGASPSTGTDPAVTVQYPHESLKMPERFRGHI